MTTPISALELRAREIIAQWPDLPPGPTHNAQIAIRWVLRACWSESMHAVRMWTLACTLTQSAIRRQDLNRALADAHRAGIVRHVYDEMADEFRWEITI